MLPILKAYKGLITCKDRSKLKRTIVTVYYKIAIR